MVSVFTRLRPIATPATLLSLVLGCPRAATETSLDGTSTSSSASSKTTAGETFADTEATSTTSADDMPNGTGSSPSTTASASENTTASTTHATTQASDPECGDGVVEGDEACDDGNLDNTDDCLNSCELPYCGDGILREDLGEECDDGNDDDADGCSNKCGRDRLVFVSSETRQGSFGAVSGANSICKTLAAEADLPNPDSFRAWLSDDIHNPTDWFTKGKGRYLLPNGIVIASSWLDLIDGQLQNPIQSDEFGNTVEYAAVWTNTTTFGAQHPDSADCEGWSTTELFSLGRLGKTWKADIEWTDNVDNPDSCSTTARFYCFEN